MPANSRLCIAAGAHPVGDAVAPPAGTEKSCMSRTSFTSNRLGRAHASLPSVGAVAGRLRESGHEALLAHDPAHDPLRDDGAHRVERGGAPHPPLNHGRFRRFKIAAIRFRTRKDPRKTKVGCSHLPPQQRDRPDSKNHQPDLRLAVAHRNLTRIPQPRRLRQTTPSYVPSR